jgi:hypothetical protein
MKERNSLEKTINALLIIISIIIIALAFFAIAVGEGNKGLLDLI